VGPATFSPARPAPDQHRQTLTSRSWANRAWTVAWRSRIRDSSVLLQASNSIPVYDLPDGSQDLGDHFVSVEAVNVGDQPIAITSWGVELPGERRLFVTRGENWATPLPHVLAPGAPPARFLERADELRRLRHDTSRPADLGTAGRVP
jgi:hypothetical protein